MPRAMVPFLNRITRSAKLTIDRYITHSLLPCIVWCVRLASLLELGDCRAGCTVATWRSPLLSKWPIRLKLLIGLGLLLLVVISLSSSGLYATYTYRSLVKGLRSRAIELPLATRLSRQVGDLRNTLGELRGIREGSFLRVNGDRGPTFYLKGDEVVVQVRLARDQFAAQLRDVEDTLAAYRRQLEYHVEGVSRIADSQREWQTLRRIEAGLATVKGIHQGVDWMLDDFRVDCRLDDELDSLQSLAAELPSHLHARLQGFADEVRGQYRALIVGMWVSSIVAAVLSALFLLLFYRWVVLPLRVLLEGSRRVAGGEFNHRIRLESRDEMAELAEAMNGMTSRFQAIRDDLDRQVQERTKQVVRSEQLASVGFLAAGVAHEINNPLASIALCAESLESRTLELLDLSNPDHVVIGNYLRMIQTEAFRCKEITEKLLDFSRAGEVRRQNTDLNELVQAVIDILGHLGKYQRKHIDFQAVAPVIAAVNSQEIKQVLLNLLTNALDCIDEDGTVQITATANDGQAELTVIDNGCGMEPEVLEHVFEPFFTRRKAGQGTGLGLSISYRIIADHGGHIEAHSDGPGRGATFRVRLPLALENKETAHRHHQAA